MPRPLEADEIGDWKRRPERIWVSGEAFDVRWHWQEEPFRDGYEGWIATTICQGKTLRAGRGRTLETLAVLAQEVRTTLGVAEDVFRVELPMNVQRLQSVLS